MQKSLRKIFTPKLKVRVVLETLKGQRTIAEISSIYGVHPTQISAWKRRFLEESEEIFSQRRKVRDKTKEEFIKALYEQIGKKDVEIAWLKKILGSWKTRLSLSAGQVVGRFVLDNTTDVSITRQAQLLGISRSSVYYQAVPVDLKTLEIMNQIDEVYTKQPYLGSRKIAVILTNLRKEDVNRKRVQRLMRVMGLEAIYPKPNLSKNNEPHPVYPYLLKNLKITHPNHVWGSDITYIRMNQGFVYLTAILDWFSRLMVAWGLSITLEKEFVIDTAKQGLQLAIPDISNVDQGLQFTNQEYIDTYESAGTRISMDSKGRYLDNIFTERLWRTIKYEEVYLKNYESVTEARQSIGE